MSALTAEQITALVAQSRNRGGAERLCRKLISSGELNVVITDELEWKGKDAQSVRNTFYQTKLRLGELGKDLKILVDKDNNRAILVNMAVLGAETDTEDE